MLPSSSIWYPGSASVGRRAGSQRETTSRLVAATSLTFRNTVLNSAVSPTTRLLGPVTVTSTVGCWVLMHALRVTGVTPSAVTVTS